MVVATHDAGGRTVIGFENSVNTSACNEWCKNFFDFYATYRNNDAKTIRDVCIETDKVMKNNTLYEYTDSEGNLISLREYVIAGEREFP